MYSAKILTFESGRHYPMLDCMRGIAIFLVLMHHASYRFSSLVSDPVAIFLATIGWAGVDVFFAISGFLITSILMRSQGRIRAFFIKRFFRIFPLYMVAILIYFIASMAANQKSVEYLWLTTLFLTGWVAPFLAQDQIPYLITWSLSVEESAYIIFGLIAIVGRSAYLKLLWFFVIFSLFLRWLLIEAGIFEYPHVYYFPLTRIDSIAYGGFVAMMGFVFGFRLIRLIALLVLTSILFAWLYAFGQYSKSVAVFGYSALSVIAALWVSFAVQFKSLKSGLLRFLAYVGRRSYFIYLFHVFVIGFFSLSFFAQLLTFAGFWGIVAIVLGVTLLLAELSWKFFELPLIDFGRRLAKGH